MYTLLVPLDDSHERSQAQTDFVEDMPGDPADYEVVLTYVLEEVQEAPPEMQRPDRAETVRAARERLEERGFEVAVLEAPSPPAEGILDLAEQREVDMIVMGSRKRSPAGKALFGSVTQAVVLDSAAPVAITGGQAEQTDE